jgi:hypothetical protein
MSVRINTGFSIFLLSGAALAYEVILVRLLAMTRFHHLAFMVLSLALLAYGVSGVLLAHLRVPLLRAFRPWFSLLATLFAGGSVVCFQLSQRIPVTPAQWVWSPLEAINLILLYLVLSLPLLAAATAVGLAYCRQQEGAGWVYRADLLGAAAGSLGGLAALWLPGAQALWVPWCAGLAAAALMTIPGRRAVAWGLLLLALLGPATNLSPAVDLRLSPDKPLAAALNAEGGQQLADVFTPLGRLTVTRNTLAPYRQASGLSLSFHGTIASQWGLFSDGEGFEPLPATLEGEEKEAFTHLDYLPEALAYRMLSRPRVLILDTPVMAALARAIQATAIRVEVVVSNPGWRKIATEPALAAVGRLFSTDRVHLTTGDPRGYLPRGASPYDLIVLGSPSPAALRADHLHTVEAFCEALERLSLAGLLSVSGPSDLPPRAGLRLLTTAAAALRRHGVATPADHIIFIRSLRSVHLLIKKAPLTRADIDTVRSFCRSRRFDPVWFPGMAPQEANRWNRLSGPHFHEGARQLLGPNGQGFQQRYKFDLAPATDDRPYFSRFLKPATLKEVFTLRSRGALGLLSLAEPVLAATLVQALFFSLLAIWLPLRRFRATRPRRSANDETPPGTLFLLLGSGFMLAEFGAMEKLRLFLHEPVLAVGVCLAAFLALAGVAGGWSTRLMGDGKRSLKTVGLAALGVAGLVLVYLAGLPALMAHLMGLSLSLRLTLAPLIIAPLAMAMGLPFPLAMAALKRRRVESVPWAWGLNGCGALLGPVVGMALAVYGGVSVVLWAAALCYGLAAAVLWRAWRA